MNEDNPMRQTLSGWLVGATTRSSQACYHEANDYDSEQYGDHGRPRGPAEESTAELLSDWFDGVMLAEWWCGEFDNYLLEKEGERDGKTDAEGEVDSDPGDRPAPARKGTEVR